MKTRIILIFSLTLLIAGVVPGEKVTAQSQKTALKKIMQKFPAAPASYDGNLQKYKMAAIYLNRDLYGNFTGKTRISGDYTRGFKDGSVLWQNVTISTSNKYADPFPAGTKQEYMENFRYLPSSDMLQKAAFKDFPASTETVFAKNLVWDMKMIEDFAWNYSDSLKISKEYLAPDHGGEFTMADVGTYEHASIRLTWTGISIMNDELCGVLEYNSPDNKINIDMEQISTKGTEQYWGNTWVSYKTGQIEFAESYSGTFQEIAVKGLKDKFLTKTIREIRVERIQ